VIIWQGKGFLVAVVVFLSSLLMQLSTEGITKNKHFYEENGWPLAGAMAIAGAIVLLLEKSILKDGSRVLVDKETGREVAIDMKHSLFFIPIKYWPYILMVIALAVLFFKRGPAV